MTQIPAENGKEIMVITVSTLFAFLAISVCALRIPPHEIQTVEGSWSDYACGADLVGLSS